MGIHYSYKNTRSAKAMEKQAKRERNLAEKKEQQLEEGMWDDLVGGISNLAKKLGVDPATADKVANAISTQPEAKAEIEKAEPAAKTATYLA